MNTKRRVLSAEEPVPRAVKSNTWHFIHTRICDDARPVERYAGNYVQTMKLVIPPNFVLACQGLQ